MSLKLVSELSFKREEVCAMCVCVCGSLTLGMTCPQVADRGDGFQIWRIAANILNKQSRTASGVVL